MIDAWKLGFHCMKNKMKNKHNVRTDIVKRMWPPIKLNAYLRYNSAKFFIVQKDAFIQEYKYQSSIFWWIIFSSWSRCAQLWLNMLRSLKRFSSHAKFLKNCRYIGPTNFSSIARPSVKYLKPFSIDFNAELKDGHNQFLTVYPG